MEKSKKKLLLHCCCAPCTVGIATELSQEYELICFFYNPNIDIEDEYNKRKEEMKKICDKFNLKLIIGDYDVELWRNTIKGLEKEPEGGKRCEKCFRLRLQKSAEIAKKLKCNLFATTLTIAPMKNHNLINHEGIEIGNNDYPKYWPSNFKKKGRFQKSVVISKKMGLYRQNYCGCSFSMNKKY